MKKEQKELVNEMMKVYENNPNVMIYVVSLMKKYEELEQRINKAIEYINKGYYEMNLNPVNFSKKLLNILYGDE